MGPQFKQTLSPVKVPSCAIAGVLNELNPIPIGGSVLGLPERPYIL